MADASALDLVAQRSTADSVTLLVRYSRATAGDARADSTTGERFDPADRRNYTPDANGTARFPTPTNSRETIVQAVVDLFERLVDRSAAVHNIFRII